MAGTAVRQVSAVATVAALAAAGVALNAGPTATPAVGALRAFDSCEQLRQWYVDAALDQVTPWGLGGGRLIPPMTALAAAEARQATVDATGSGATGTNVQEAGVDEPDLAKTDGDKVVLLDGQVLRVVDVTGSQPRVLGRLRLPAKVEARELLLVDERAVVLGTTWDTHPTGGAGRITGPVWSGQPQTVLTTVDLSDPADLRVVGTERIEGDLVTSREHAGVLRVVLRTTPDLPFVQPWAQPGVEDDRSGRPGRAEARALEANRQAIRAATVEDWLPSRVLPGAQGEGRTRTEPLLGCDDVRHPSLGAGVGTLTVLTMDPRRPSALDATGLAADGDLVYSSAERLYAATTVGGWTPWLGFEGVAAERSVGNEPRDLPVERRASTQVHAFDVSGRDTTYVASGRVDGLALDRWAFSEQDGLLRVATTRGLPWAPEDSAIAVLEEDGDRLAEVGSVAGLGVGERIRAVRWFGDLAVVVTFRQTDPLYTVDLSEPAKPEVVGELQMPGYSAYLHPVGEDLLLGVGQDATRAGQATGTKVSTYDLHDLSAPRRVDDVRPGPRGGSYSPVEGDSRAFTYLPDARVALVPYGSWYDGSSHLAVVAVRPDGRLGLSRDLDLPGTPEQVRALPLGGDRVAVVADGDVDRILVTG